MRPFSSPPLIEPTRGLERWSRVFGLLVAFALSASLASAAEEGGKDPLKWYFEFSTGATFVPNQTLRDGATSMSRAEPETGYFVGGALGNEVIENVRVELRIDFHDSDMEQAALVSPATTTDGEVTLLSVMANAYYDFDLGLRHFIPYVGGGIGYGLLAFDLQRDTLGEFDVDDNDHVFVYNAIVGARIPITRISELSLGYRYVGTEGSDAIGSSIAGLQQDIRAEYDAHEVMLGLRFNF